MIDFILFVVDEINAAYDKEITYYLIRRNDIHAVYVVGDGSRLIIEYGDKQTITFHCEEEDVKRVMQEITNPEIETIRIMWNV